FCGGPVDQGRGFVLHSSDRVFEDSTLQIDEKICLTASSDILKSLAFGSAPKNSLLALGYCGWGSGQLEDELKQNGWLITNYSDELLFNVPTSKRYDRALKQLGATRASLSPVSGNA
ncbi:MAG: YqgE/AlgH family protein, partial [Devosiaceae bacterium]|nr:YqgE/AlgH family protein [Devosiaceae bacterium]